MEEAQVPAAASSAAAQAAVQSVPSESPSFALPTPGVATPALRTRGTVQDGGNATTVGV